MPPRRRNVRRRAPTPNRARAAAINQRRRAGAASRKKRSFIYKRTRKAPTPKTRVHAPTDSVRETFMVVPGSRKRCKGSTNIWTSSPDGANVACQSGAQSGVFYYLNTATQLRMALTATAQQPANNPGFNVDTSSIFWRRAKDTMMFTNLSNSCANVTVYHYVAKRDTNKNMSDVWLAGLQDAQGNTTDNRTIYGCEPQLSPVLVRYWRHLKTFDFTIAPGSTIKHNWIVNMNRVINNEVIAVDVNPNDYLGGITHACMILVKGFPAVNTTGGLPNTAPVKITAVEYKEYRYTYISDNTNTMKYDAGTTMGGVNAAVTVYDANGSATNSEPGSVI